MSNFSSKSVDSTREKSGEGQYREWTELERVQQKICDRNDSDDDTYANGLGAPSARGYMIQRKVLRAINCDLKLQQGPGDSEYSGRRLQ